MYRLIEKLHLERYLNSRLILAIDLVVSGVASLCALVLVRLLLPPLSNISKFALLWIGCAVVYSFITFFLLKTYRSVIRHSTLREIAKFVVAVIGKELLLGLTFLLYPPTPLFGMHMLALLLFDLLLTLCGLILIRVAMIIVYDLVKNNLKSRKQHQLVLVYGLSEKSVSLVTRLQSSPHYKVVGFLTFGRRMKNHTIAECPVYYFENEYSIRYLRQRYDIDAVLFPTNEEAQTEQERLIRYCVESNLKILIAPPIDEVIDGKIMRQSIREIKIEDLLGRPEIKISLDEIRANFREKTVMVTGAAGSIGSELCRQLASFGIKKLILFDNAETPMHNLRLELEERFPKLEFVPVIGDIRLPNRLDFAFRTFRPDGSPSDVAHTKYVKAPYAEAVTAPAALQPGLKAVWHDFRGNLCADIDAAPVKGEYVVESVSIPEEVKGNIGLVMTGYLEVPADGIYTFALLSDDGSTLTLDGELLGDNDGAHSSVEIIVQKALKAGLHPIEVRYFDCNGGVLQMELVNEKGEKEMLPGAWLKHEVHARV